MPVHDLGYISPPACATAARAAPAPSCDPLHRLRGNLLTDSRHANDNALAPSAMATFQRLPHGGDIADAFEREIRTASGQVDNSLHHLVTANLIWIDEMRHAEFLSRGAFGRIGVDADDLVGADHPRALDHVEPDPTEAEQCNVGARPDLGGVYNGDVTGGDATTDVANLVERCVIANLGERNLGQH